MKYIINSVTLLLLVASTIVAQRIEDVFIQSHIIKLTNAKAYTLKVAALMPEANYDFKPHADEMNFARQLVHISQNLCWLSSSYLNEGANPLTAEEGKLTNKNEISVLVAKAYDFAIAAIQNLPVQSLTDTVKFFTGPMNKLQIINLVEDHQTHHRAQLLVYLRLNGIKPPDYVGW